MNSQARTTFFSAGNLAAAAGCGMLFFVGIVGVAPSSRVAVAYLTACAAITGWLCGRWWGLPVLVVAMIAESTIGPNVAEEGWPTFAARWGIACGLLIAAAVVRSRLDAERRRARIDALTGLPNRTAFFERSSAELSRARRSGRPITLMLLDGDDFKSVNDARGHAAGDQALRATSRALRESVRPYDVVCRWGGDEFAILFPDTTAEAARTIAERIQAALRQRLAASTPLSYCMGVVTSAGSPADLDVLLAQADEALYQAKRHGKCTIRCRVCPPEEQHGAFSRD